MSTDNVNHEFAAIIAASYPLSEYLAVCDWADVCFALAGND